jgi:hypothetical protein
VSTRADVAAASRVVVKVGSSSLTTLPGGLDVDRLRALVDVLGALRAAGRQVVLVSSGAIAAGLAPLGLTGRPRDLATAQAAASRSLSPKRISSVATVSFSLTIGSTPRASSRSIVCWALR